MGSELSQALEGYMLYTCHLSIVETEEGYCIPAKLGLHSFENIK